MKRNFLILLTALFFTVFISACSVSKSVDSSATVISMPFKSSSNKSSSTQASLQADTATYTIAFLQDGKDDIENFQYGLASIAQSHGISNWQDDGSTWVGIGQGLKGADLHGKTPESFVALVADNEMHQTLILQAYHGNI